MNELWWFACGIIVAAVLDIALRFWGRHQYRERRRNAGEVLKRHGLTPQLYLATVDEDDPELRSALDEFAFSGYIITNAKGNVVGRLCPKVVKGPHLRLVVSNDKPLSTI